MLLSSHLSPLKTFGVATLVSFSVFLLLNFYIFTITSGRRIFDPLRVSLNCDADAVSSSISTEAPEASKLKALIPPLAIAPNPVAVTITVTEAALNSPSSPTATSIPNKLWYKLGPKGLTKDSNKWIETCLKANPTFRHEFLTDESGDYYVREFFGYRKDIVDTYLALSVPILKADFLRYLILYAEGGIWNDLDVSCENTKTIHEWIPEEHKKATSIVVGLEFDWGWEDDDFLHSQFASWTIVAKPKSQHMLQVIDDIVEGIREKAEEHDCPIKDLKYNMVGDVVDITGPKRMTRSIVKSLELTLGTTIDDRNISGLKEPKLIGDVLVLPGNSFAAAQSGNPKDQGPALVTHHYAGSWKNDHGGELA